VTLYAIQGASGADWLQAWGTVVAAVGTVGALVYQARALAHERRARREDIARLEAEQRAAAAAQARTIVLHDARCTGRPNQFVDAYGVTLGNYGSQPITNVRLKLCSTVDGREIVINDRGPAFVPVLASNVRIDLSWDLKGCGVVWHAGTDTEKVPDMFVIELQFVDSNGMTWLRRPGEEPIRADATT
jgi:hypothetical protein